MRVIIGSLIKIENYNGSVEEWCKKNLILDNPLYVTLSRLGKEDTIRRKHVPETIKNYVRRGSALELPFGCLYGIWSLIKDCEIILKTNNNKDISIKNKPCPVELYDYQEPAIDYMVKAKGGVLVSPCGSGKTFMGIEIIRRIGKKFLWLTHTADLLRQTYGEFKSLYPNIDIGLITEGKLEFGRDGCIATVQTLSKIDPMKYREEFDVVVVDECFPAGTLISTEDGYKKIEDLKIGDLVYSYNEKNELELQKVNYLFKKEAKNLCKINLANKENIVCTRNHPIYTKRGYIKAEEVNENDFVLRMVRKIFEWIRVENLEIQEPHGENGIANLCPDGYVYNIEVEKNNNYFANNYLVHNCAHCVGSPDVTKMFSKIMDNIPARYKYGLTATPSRSDTMIETMYALIGMSKKGEFEPTYKISKEEVKTIIAEHRMVPLNTYIDPNAYVYDIDGTIIFNELINYLSFDEKRNKIILDNIEKCAKEGRKQVVLALRKEHIKLLYDELIARGLNATYVVGETSKKLREERLKTKTDEWDIIIATYSLFKEGINIKKLDTLHLTVPQKAKDVIVQSAGRIERYVENKKQPIIFDYVDQTVNYCVKAYNSRKSSIKRRYG